MISSIQIQREVNTRSMVFPSRSQNLTCQAVTLVIALILNPATHGSPFTTAHKITFVHPSTEFTSRPYMNQAPKPQSICRAAANGDHAREISKHIPFIHFSFVTTKIPLITSFHLIFIIPTLPCHAMRLSAISHTWKPLSHSNLLSYL